MIRSLAELCMHEGSKVERAAVVSDLRGGEVFGGLAGILDELRAEDVSFRLVFLLADEQTLLNRYKETRRRHPLATHGTVVDGDPPRAGAAGPDPRAGGRQHRHVRAEAGMLRRKVADELLEPESPGKLVDHLHLLRAQARPAARRRPGLRRALPAQPALRARPAPADRVRRAHRRLRRAATGAWSSSTSTSSRCWTTSLPQYVAEGKAHLVIAIGCTGGRHRSVVIAEHLAAHFRTRGDAFVEVQHRDVDRAPALP